jgi:hypothetical protein
MKESDQDKRATGVYFRYEPATYDICLNKRQKMK